MSTIIKVSYTDENELNNVLKLLKPITKKYKISKEKKGEHYNAYVTVTN
jgi:hypothetical protein